jgi:hypothetical protein
MAIMNIDAMMAAMMNPRCVLDVGDMSSTEYSEDAGA